MREWRIEKDALKIIVKEGAKVVARFFSSEAGIFIYLIAMSIRTKEINCKDISQ